MTDRALVERARRGDRDAYERLALETGDRLMAVAQRIVRDIDWAEEAVQQTLVAIWTNLPGLRDPGRFDAWAYRMLIRFCLAETRRHRRLRIAVGPLPNEVREPTDELEGVGVRDQLERAFGAISADHRAVLVLHHYLGLSHAEIASVLGVPAGTVSSRIHRATEQMRAALDAGARIVTGERALA